MKPFYYVAEFHNLHIKITKQALHEFIKKLLDESLSLYWRYDDETIFLMIDNDENLCEIPFYRKDDYFIVDIDELIVHDEKIVNAIEMIISQFNGNGIVKKFTGGPLYITSYETGLIQSITEIDGSDKIMMNKYGSIVEYREYDNDLEPQTIVNIMNLEIDYTLMELHDALKEQDYAKIETYKKKLEKLRTRREQVKQLL